MNEKLDEFIEVSLMGEFPVFPDEFTDEQRAHIMSDKKPKGKWVCTVGHKKIGDVKRDMYGPYHLNHSLFCRQLEWHIDTSKSEGTEALENIEGSLSNEQINELLPEVNDHQDRDYCCSDCGCSQLSNASGIGLYCDACGSDNLRRIIKNKKEWLDRIKACFHRFKIGWAVDAQMLSSWRELIVEVKQLQECNKTMENSLIKLSEKLRACRAVESRIKNLINCYDYDGYTGPIERITPNDLKIALEPLEKKERACDHAWIDASNDYVSETALCIRCGKLGLLSDVQLVDLMDPEFRRLLKKFNEDRKYET